MKMFICVLSLGFSLMAAAMPVHKIKLERYVYAGSFLEMSKSLEKELIKDMEDKCGPNDHIEIHSLTTDFGLGQLSSGHGLIVEVRKGALAFPHHPKAILEATFLCE